MSQNVIGTSVDPGDIQVPVMPDLPAETAVAAAAGVYPNGDLQIPSVNYPAREGSGSEPSGSGIPEGVGGEAGKSSRNPLTAIMSDDDGQQIEVPAFVAKHYGGTDSRVAVAQGPAQTGAEPSMGDPAAAPVVAEAGSVVATKPPLTDVVSKSTSFSQASPTQPTSAGEKAGATLPSPASGGVVLRPRPKGAPRTSAATPSQQAATPPKVEPFKAKPEVPKQASKPPQAVPSRPRQQLLGQAIGGGLRKVASKIGGALGNAVKKLRQSKPAAQQRAAAKPASTAKKPEPSRQAAPSRPPESAKPAPKKPEEETGPKPRPQQSAPQKGGDLGQKVGHALAGAAQRLRQEPKSADRGEKPALGAKPTGAKPAGDAPNKPAATTSSAGDKPAGDKGAGDAAKKTVEGAVAAGAGVLNLTKYVPILIGGGIMAFLILGLGAMFGKSASIVISKPQAVIAIVLFAWLGLITLLRR